MRGYKPFDSWPSVPPEPRYVRVCSATQSHCESVARSRSSATAMVTSFRSGDGISAELLGQCDDETLGAADVAEPVAVPVLHQLSQWFGAVRARPGQDSLDVLDGE